MFQHNFCIIEAKNKEKALLLQLPQIPLLIGNNPVSMGKSTERERETKIPKTKRQSQNNDLKILKINAVGESSKGGYNHLASQMSTG